MIFEVFHSLFILAQHLFVLMSVYVVFHCQFVEIFMPRFYDFLKLFGKALINLILCFNDLIPEFNELRSS